MEGKFRGGEEVKSVLKYISGICLCLLLAVLPGTEIVRAEETIWPVEGQDHIYVDGSLRAKAGTEKDSQKGKSSEGTLNQYRNSIAAYYGSQLTQENEQAIYAQLVSASQQNRIRSAQNRASAIEIKLAKKVEIPAIEGTQSAAYKNLCSEIGKATDAFLFDYNENYWVFG